MVRPPRTILTDNGLPSNRLERFVRGEPAGTGRDAARQYERLSEAFLETPFAWESLAMSIRCQVASLTILVMLFSGHRAEAGRIRGNVVDREDKPAAGAKIQAVKLPLREPFETHETVADGPGAFTIDAGAGDWIVFALRGHEAGDVGWNPNTQVEVRDGKEPAPVTIQLRGPTNLRGRLFNATTGRPLTEGWVAVDRVHRARLDAGGRFEVPGLRLTSHTAAPRCPGYEGVNIVFDTTDTPDAELEVKIRPGVKVVGQVLDEQGKPIPAATVGPLTGLLREGCSEDGRFAYEGLPLEETIILSAQAPGFVPQEQDVFLDETSPTIVVRFTLRRTPAAGTRARPPSDALPQRTISGTVIGPRGKPAGSATVRWVPLVAASRGQPDTPADTDGRFRLEGVPDTRGVLFVQADKLAPTFVLVERGDCELKIELKAGATIRGRVVDELGTPIAGASVSPLAPDPSGGNAFVFTYPEDFRVRTDRDGRFVFEAIPEGAVCDVLAECWGAERRRPLSTTEENKNVIVMQSEGAISGRVVAPSGKPVRNFRILIQAPRVRQKNDPIAGGSATLNDTGVTFTRDDGQFTVTGSLRPGGLCLVRAVAEGFGLGEVDRVAAQPLHHLDPDQAVTILLEAPHALRVRVTTAEGQPVERARLTLLFNQWLGRHDWNYRLLGDWTFGRTDPQGWAEFRGLAFASGTVRVRAKGLARRLVPWPSGQEELQIALVPEARVSGTVLDEAGRPLASSRIVLTSEDDAQTMSVPIDESDGRFLADELAPGRYQLMVVPSDPRYRRAGNPSFAEAIELKAGVTMLKDIRVKRAGPRTP
jgi:hypothetical protein